MVKFRAVKEVAVFWQLFAENWCIDRSISYRFCYCFSYFVTSRWSDKGILEVEHCSETITIYKLRPAIGVKISSPMFLLGDC